MKEIKTGGQVTVLGSGSWGTALAHHVKRAGFDVCVWGIDLEALEQIGRFSRNPAFFPEDKLVEGIRTETDLALAVKDAQALVMSVPSSVMGKVAGQLKSVLSPGAVVVNTAKGLEEGTFALMTEVLERELGEAQPIAALSGPSFALEVLRGLPTAVTVAAKRIEWAEEAAKIFHFDNMRIYTSTDVFGVQFGGVTKNIIALAAGVVDGVGMGLNARAALITRGLAELQRLVVALGGDPRTVMGLSGLGDLLLTATGDLSRNRRVGLRLGKGEKLEDILADIGQVAEGVKATHIVLDLARKHNVNTPIVEEVDRIVRGEHTVKQAIGALLSRERKQEN